MTKVKLETELFYPGYPVFVFMTKTKTDEVLAFTASSSYTLGDKLFMGMGNNSHTAQYLAVGTEISVNFLSPENGLISDICGIVSHRERPQWLEKAGAHIAEENDVPYLVEAPLSLFGTITEIRDDGEYLSLFVTISERLIDEKLTQGGKLLDDKYSPLLYIGDDKQRAYKHVHSDYLKKAGYIKEFRNHDK